MNTEQLKTKEEILTAHLLNAGCLDEDDLKERLDDGTFEPELKAMQDFASQESKIAVEKDRESRWISVKERLPEPKEQVLVYQPPKKWSHKDEMTKGRVLIGYMFRLPQDERGTWIDLNELNDKACSLRQGGLFWAFPYICHQNFVSHWQPLPEPPKQLTPELSYDKIRSEAMEKPNFESQSKTIYPTERRQKAFQEGCEHVWNTHVVPLLSDFESNQRSVYSLNGRCNQLDSENKVLQEKLKIAEHLKELADDAIVTLQKEVEKLKADNESLLMFKLYLD